MHCASIQIKQFQAMPSSLTKQLPSSTACVKGLAWHAYMFLLLVLELLLPGHCPPVLLTCSLSCLSNILGNGADVHKLLLQLVLHIRPYNSFLVHLMRPDLLASSWKISDEPLHMLTRAKIALMRLPCCLEFTAAHECQNRWCRRRQGRDHAGSAGKRAGSCSKALGCMSVKQSERQDNHQGIEKSSYTTITLGIAM